MIHIFGIGANGLESLSRDATDALSNCKTIFGGARHLEMLPERIKKHPWPQPWRLPAEEISKAEDPVAIIVTGDPSWFSVTKQLTEIFDCQIWPTLGAFSLAAARLGWALEDVQCDSLHGRGSDTAEEIAGYISSLGGRHLLLSDKKSFRQFIDALLSLNFTPISHLTLLCDMGTEDEKHLTVDLDDPLEPDTDLFTISIDLEIAPRLLLDADFLDDNVFESHGKITKFEARQSAIAHLRNADILWDVGAGSGTVGLQAGYSLQPRQLYLIEDESEALKILERNCANSSSPSIIVEGSAPESLKNLPRPDAVFIGGGLSNPEVLKVCFEELTAGGRLVAHAVTLESEQVLLDFFQKHNEAKLSRITISNAEEVGRMHGWRPTMPLTQLVIEKPA